MKKFIWMLSFMLVCECHAEDITIRYKGLVAKVTQTVKDSVNVTVEGAKVNIESLYTDRKLTLKLTGNSDDGQLNLKTAGKAKVTLDGLMLTSQEGAPICLKNKKKVEVSVAVGGLIGDMPSVPTNETAKQPTLLLTGLSVVKDEPIYINDESGKTIFTVTIPFSMRRSATLVTNPAFKLGSTYTLKTKDYEKTFVFSEPFTAYGGYQ